MTPTELVRWLEGVRGVAHAEGERWRALRQPGDLKIAGWTTDRVHLHAVGELLGRIEICSKVAAEDVRALQPPVGRVLGHARGCSGQGCAGECAASPCPHGTAAAACSECRP